MNRTFSLLFFFFLVVLFTAGCSGRAVHKKLDHIEAFAAEYPDSARRVLEAMDRDLLDTPKLQARHALMLSTALSRCKIPAPDDSLINLAVNYFRIHGPKREKFLSYYYQGRIYDDLENYEAAMRSYIQAENIHSKDISLRYLTSLQLRKGHLYYAHYSIENALDAYYKAADLATQCNWTRNYITALCGCISVYSLTKEYEKIDSLHNLISQSLDSQDEALRRIYYIEKAQQLYNTNAPQDSLLRYADALYPSITKLSNGDLAILALAYNAAGAPEKANRVLSQYLESTSNPEDDATYYLIDYHIKDSLHLYEESLRALEKHFQIGGRNEYNRLRKDTRFVEERTRFGNRRHTFIVWATIFGTLGFVLIMILALLLRKWGKEINEINLLYQSMKEEQNELSSILQSNAELQEQARTLLGERITAIGKFLAKDKPKFLNQVSDQLENLTENRKRLLETIGMLYAIYHPGFISKLMQKNLSPAEIGYCCLLQLGFRTGEISDVINRSSTYNISSAIRQKLGLGPRDTNLSIFIKELYRSSIV